MQSPVFGQLGSKGPVRNIYAPNAQERYAARKPILPPAPFAVGHLVHRRGLKRLRGLMKEPAPGSAAKLESSISPSPTLYLYHELIKYLIKYLIVNFLKIDGA